MLNLSFSFKIIPRKVNFFIIFFGFLFLIFIK